MFTQNTEEKKKTNVQSLLRVKLILYYVCRTCTSDIPLNRLSHNPFAKNISFPLYTSQKKKTEKKIILYMTLLNPLIPVSRTSGGCHI